MKLKRITLIFINLFLTLIILYSNNTYTKVKINYLSIIGYPNSFEGIASIPHGIADNIGKNLKVTFINALLPCKKPLNEKITILCVPLRFTGFNPDIMFNNNKMIKIAYSMHEATILQEKTVIALNKYFDMIVVPDSFLVDVYKNSGIKKPIFMLPIGLNLNDFLKVPLKKYSHKPFIFGSAGSIGKRKNYKVLVKAFLQEFKNNEKVKLKINGRFCEPDELNVIKKIILKEKATNVEIIYKKLLWKDYVKFISSIDCYVNISLGEGFSMPPREALAMGIPCILSNNTAQKTICESGFVRIVNSNIQESANSYYYDNDNLGYVFNSSIEDVKEALIDVYENYSYYLNNSSLARLWAKQYTWENLKPYYMSLFKPKNIILGNNNIITKNSLITNSKELYKKYQKIKRGNYVF